MISRREFLDSMAVGVAGVAISSTAKSYGQILGSNERLNFAVIGLHGRAYAHLSSLKANEKDAKITHVCDVDSNFLQKFAGSVEQILGYAPASDRDFRKVLASKDVDAITIATPDHWHAPWRSRDSRRASMPMLRSPAVTIRRRVCSWCRLSGSMASTSRWGRSDDPHRCTSMS